MSGSPLIGDYTKAGFWYLAFKKRYIGFCQDVQLLNDEPVSQEDMNIAWIQTVTKLHATWVKGDGARDSKKYHDMCLLKATVQTKGDFTDEYWQGLVASTGKPELLDSGADLAGIEMSSLVTSHDTGIPELEDGRYYDDAEHASIYAPVYTFNNTGAAGQMSQEDIEMEEKEITEQLSLFAMSRDKGTSEAEKAEVDAVEAEISAKIRAVLDLANEMDCAE